MNEQEWLECTDPQPMLESIRGSASDRKLRLFACGCCRSIWQHLKLKHDNRKTLEFAERFADGLATRDQLHGRAWGKTGDFGWIVMRKAWDAAESSAEVASAFLERDVRALDPEACEKNRATFEKLSDEGFHLGESYQMADAVSPSEWVEKGRAARRGEQHKQATLVRDIFGNPFRPVAIDPAWLTPKAAALAQAIYADRRFADLPLLADALAEAGCTDADILDHCRQPAEHVRGCWVVDLLLGKT
jgi:hypothetical protein